MIQYTCDVCGKPMPENYIRPKQRSGQLTRACRVDDVCASCEAAGRQIDALCWQRGGQPLGHRLQSAILRTRLCRRRCCENTA